MKKKILIVDDEVMILELLKEEIESWGHDVHCADNGIECGIQLFDTHSTFDVILMDLHMPEQDGVKTIKYLRGGISEEHKKVKIIVITAHCDEKVKNILAKYDVPILEKPIDLKKLKNLIEEE